MQINNSIVFNENVAILPECFYMFDIARLPIFPILRNGKQKSCLALLIRSEWKQGLQCILFLCPHPGRAQASAFITVFIMLEQQDLPLRNHFLTEDNSKNILSGDNIISIGK